MTDLLQQIISILVAGTKGIAQCVGTGLTNLAKAMFVTGEGNALSIFCGLVIEVKAALDQYLTTPELDDKKTEGGETE